MQFVIQALIIRRDTYADKKSTKLQRRQWCSQHLSSRTLGTGYTGFLSLQHCHMSDEAHLWGKKTVRTKNSVPWGAAHRRRSWDAGMIALHVEPLSIPFQAKFSEPFWIFSINSTCDKMHDKMFDNWRVCFLAFGEHPLSKEFVSWKS